MNESILADKSMKDFKYSGLMKIFCDIAEIPRPTFHEQKIASFICDFAAKRGLEYRLDKNNNVFVRLPGSLGRENEPAILLQGHSDMVCEKNEGVEHDFLSEGIKLRIEDGWLRACGTTLGADNGVAVATMLYILDGAQGELGSHPPVECLFTSSEEVGLIGAKTFDYSCVSARRMINLDSADEAWIIAGCAGGERMTLRYSAQREACELDRLRITLKGLAGGHSGEDINKGRANANKLMGRVLYELSEAVELRLVSIEGGSKDNAIPRECEAVVCVGDTQAAVKRLESCAEVIKGEICRDDEGFSLSYDILQGGEMAFPSEDSRRIVFFVHTVNNGVFAMVDGMEGLVEYSRNLGIITTKEQTVSFVFSARSSKPSRLRESAGRLEAYARELGMQVEYGESYPGWDYAQSSDIREAYARAYRELFGEEPSVTAIHAGLECGIIKERLPDMDMISCGPVILDLHSPDEAMNIASFGRFFAVIKRILESL